MSIGPFVISLHRLFLLAGVLVAFGATALMLRGEKRARGSSILWTSILAGVIAARIAYVLTHGQHYRENLFEILHVWDGGLNAVLGMATAFVVAAWLAVRREVGAGRVLASLLIGMSAWGLLHVGASIMRDEHSPVLADITLSTLDGKPTQLRSFVGKPVVLNLWATWCPPCRREMPVLSAAQAEHENVHFVFANQNETADEVRRFLIAQRLPIENVLLDEGLLATEYRAPGLPTTLFFDRDGRLRRVHLGELSAPRLADYLSSID
ncbi:TlpA disulfide reductase family protein [Steroidobacter cummioxidans]|uniref:TlpA disulfide reductase family protein n=1 Tax=Steroidobacter cummioxidans TaxID=1803913 RepID=UPI000E317C6F|nr:TlpA disulfide reductase family protein [Steroidobacter cummioxidans]